MIEDIKKTLWARAGKLRANMDAAEYKHIVLLTFQRPKLITRPYHSRKWIFPPLKKGGPGGIYQDIPAYCRSVTLAEIAEHGAEAVEDDDEVFAEKIQKLTEKLGEQMAKGAELDQLIRQMLGGLGYEF